MMNAQESASAHQSLAPRRSPGLLNLVPSDSPGSGYAGPREQPTGVPDGLRHALADRYRLEHELGQGGMATVYLAEDLKQRRPPPE
jgi:hypothetical protein